MRFLSSSKFGNGLSPFGDGVLCQFTRQDKSDSGLDLTGGNGWLLIVASKTRRLLSKFLKYIVDEAVHDAHGLTGDSNVRMNLFEDLEDVNLVSLAALLNPPLLLPIATFLGNLLLRLGRHLIGCGWFLIGRGWLLLSLHWCHYESKTKNYGYGNL